MIHNNPKIPFKPCRGQDSCFICGNRRGQTLDISINIINIPDVPNSFSTFLFPRSTHDSLISFSQRICKYYNRFCTRREGCIVESVESESTTALEVLQVWNPNQEVDRWEDAELVDVFCYLRGSKNLCLNDEWRKVLPTSAVPSKY